MCSAMDVPVDTELKEQTKLNWLRLNRFGSFRLGWTLCCGSLWSFPLLTSFFSALDRSDRDRIVDRRIA